MTTPLPDPPVPEIQQIVDAIRTRQRFVISSHSRPDGDSLGSQMAMAYALRALGKDVTVVNADAAPPPLMASPGVPGIQIAPAVAGDFDAAIMMECGDLARTGVAGSIALRHQHRSSPGNTGFGAINWFDRAPPRAEMVFDLIRARRALTAGDRRITWPYSPTPAVHFSASLRGPHHAPPWKRRRSGLIAPGLRQQRRGAQPPAPCSSSKSDARAIAVLLPRPRDGARRRRQHDETEG